MAAKQNDELHPDDDPPERMPRANPALFGQEEAEAALMAAWKSGRMPHAWLISGPRGIGKATLAFRFARFALSGGGADVDPSAQLLITPRGSTRGADVDPSAQLLTPRGSTRGADVDPSAQLLTPRGSTRGADVDPSAQLLITPRGSTRGADVDPSAQLLVTPRGSTRGGVGGQGSGLINNEPPSMETDPSGRVFQRVAALGHSDFRLVRRSLNKKTGKWRQEISIEDVRDMGQFLRLTAGEGDWRIIVIDSADEMTNAAMNAALKAIEEPPPRALVLLVSHAPGRLLPTIRSRCRRLDLSPLDDATVKKVAARHLPDLSPDELDELARLADGSAGRALTLADHGGVELHRDMLAILGDFPRIDELALDKLGDKLGRSGAEEGFRVFGEMLTGMLGRLCRDRRADRRVAEANLAEAPVSERLAAVGGLDRWLDVWEKLAQLFARAESAKLDRKQVVVDAVLTMGAAARM